MIVSSLCGVIALGRLDFDRIEPLRDAQAAVAEREARCCHVEEAVCGSLGRMQAASGLRPTTISLPTSGRMIPVDVDTTVLEEAYGKKEGVGGTYQRVLGYTPWFADIGSEGYVFDAELRTTDRRASSGPTCLTRLRPSSPGMPTTAPASSSTPHTRPTSAWSGSPRPTTASIASCCRSAAWSSTPCANSVGSPCGHAASIPMSMHPYARRHGVADPVPSSMIRSTSPPASSLPVGAGRSHSVRSAPGLRYGCGSGVSSSSDRPPGPGQPGPRSDAETGSRRAIVPDHRESLASAAFRRIRGDVPRATGLGRSDPTDSGNKKANPCLLGARVRTP